MKKILSLGLLLLLGAGTAQAQTKFNSRTATATFYAASALQDAKAENHQARIVLDVNTREIAISMLISSFEFEKALMQTHFNSDLESETYPKSTFSGKIVSPETFNAASGEKVAVKVKGDLTIHGVTKPIEVDGTLQFSKGKIIVHSAFHVDCKDYKVAPRAGVDSKIEITFDATLNPAQ